MSKVLGWILAISLLISLLQQLERLLPILLVSQYQSFVMQYAPDSGYNFLSEARQAQFEDTFHGVHPIRGQMIVDTSYANL
jgi:hypothetical protein